MPWMIRKRNGGYQVYKQGQDGEPTGEALGTHASEDDAKRQLAALYANEPTAKAVKFADGSEDLIEGTGMPWGGNFNGRDLDSQFFSSNTDFAFQWFGKGARPALYHHGLDDSAGTAVVGRVKDWEVRPELGVWTQVQLDKQNKYFSAIKELVKQGKLYFSSGAMAHLVQIDGKSGEIKRWPWVELSLTPTPANLLATVDLATAKAHLKAVGTEDLPDALKMPKPAMRQMMAEMAEDMEMEMSEAEMTEMMAEMDPDMPEPEMRAEMQKKMQAHKQQMGKPRGMAEGKPNEQHADHKSVKALSGSYEELIERLCAIVNPPNPFAPANRWTCIEATFPGYVIARVKEPGGETIYRVAYTLDADGKPKLGEATEVEQTYTPAAPETETVSTQLQALAVAKSAAALSQRTKDLTQRRVKEGRVLSAANRNRLAECLASMRAATDDLAALLDNTEPQTAKAASVWRQLRARNIETFAQQLAVQ